VEQKRNAAGTSPAIDALLESLNPAQRSAVTFGVEAEGGRVPPLLIAAGAGTGKTKTLAHRVARLILGGVDPLHQAQYRSVTGETPSRVPSVSFDPQIARPRPARHIHPMPKPYLTDEERAAVAALVRQDKFPIAPGAR
jgi:hypothetical protein